MQGLCLINGVLLFVYASKSIDKLCATD